MPVNSTSVWKIGQNRNLLAAPVILISPAGKRIQLKIDKFLLRNGRCALGGWASEKLKINLEHGGQKLEILREAEICRPDVNEYLGDSPNARHGFALAAKYEVTDAPMLLLELDGSEIKLPLPKPDVTPFLEAGLQGLMGEEIYQLALGDDAMDCLLSTIGDDSLIRGAIDHAIRWPDAHRGNPLVCAGWLAMPDGWEVLAGDENGLSLTTVNPIYFSRPDICLQNDLFINNTHCGNGFIFSFNNFIGGKICLYLKKDDFLLRIASQDVTNCLNFRGFLQKLFEIDIAPSDLAEIYAEIYAPLLCGLNRARCQAVLKAAHSAGQFGEVAENPEISVIIPLYGNLDLLERQFSSLARERAFSETAEIIYVLDDPRIVEEFKTKAANLASRWHCGLRWLAWNGSQGFAGANNLGASIARGHVYIFLNSDVFPETPGWSEAFASYLSEKDDVGLAGCKLVYEDGGLQHLRVEFEFDSVMAIWKCRHPQKGQKIEPCEPELETRAVTGACVAMRKENYEAAGGWSADYLLGGYEDIDLCLRLWQMGKKIVCLPQIQMTHLESRTFASLPREKWLDRLAVFNGVVFTEYFDQFLKSGSANAR